MVLQDTSYYDIVVESVINNDIDWYYPSPFEPVRYIAFWKDVSIED